MYAGLEETGSLPAPAAAARPWTAGARGVLAGLVRRYWPRLALTYLMFAVENLLALLLPMCLGGAIDGLLRGSSSGLLLLLVAYLAHLLAGASRRAYDSRCFTSIYRDVASAMVAEQRGRGVDVSRVAGRSALARSLVEFLESDLPQAMHTGCSLLGALLLLWCYDGRVALLCASVAAPCWLLNAWYRRHLARHNRELHDEMEREVDVIRANEPAEVRGHFGRLARSWVRISDWEALNLGLAQALVAGLVAVSLLHLCGRPGTSLGEIFAVLRYVLLFVAGVDGVPLFARQLARLEDIAARLRGRGQGEP